MRIFLEYILYFYIYGILGWVCEIIYCSYFEKKFVNRGMLKGPLCPIYGVGSIFILLSVGRFSDNVINLFIFSVIITSTLEYLTSFLLEHLFNSKWWDYSENKFNINGRICALNSFLFGILAVLLIKFIHPFIIYIMGNFNMYFITTLLVIASIIFIYDFISTIYVLLLLNGKLKEISNIISELKIDNICFHDFLESEFKKARKKREGKKIIRKEKADEIIKRLLDINEKMKQEKRIFKAFPSFKHKEYDVELKGLKELLKLKQIKRDDK